MERDEGTRNKLAIAVVVALLLPCTSVPAAQLPSHGPLRILIVSDEVNPHGLSDAELSQPGDLSAAILDPASGLSVDAAPDGLVEIATDDLDQATALLALPSGDPAAYDVLIYFAHRQPTGPTGPALQAAFVAEVESFLTSGGGVVSFHHGVYLGPGKTAMLEILGGTASGAVPWNTTEGQRVIAVAPTHWIAHNAVEYPSTTSYTDPARGVPSAAYPSFTNVPDERYIDFEINPSAEQVELLFASDYVENGSTHVLGFTHQRASWQGRVVVYQPGEYQPNALDDLEGNNFQILANAIVFAAGQEPSGATVPALTVAAQTLVSALLLATAFAVFRKHSTAS